MKIGVISDTHNFLDPQIPELFAGVSHILHAGDIGLPRVLTQLESIAPVTAVGGNTDDPVLRHDETKIAGLAGRRRAGSIEYPKTGNVVAGDGREICQLR